MKYFVTGATGFIGGSVARQLRSAGHEVHALVRDPARARDLQAVGVRLFRGDVTDPTTLSEPMAGTDGVFHLAAWYEIGTRNRARAEEINVRGTQHVLDTMRTLGIAKGVYTSSVAVFSDTHGRLVDETYRHDGPWLTLYDRTKWQAHYEVALPAMRSGLPLVIVQPGLVYGPGDRSITHRTILRYLRRKLPVSPRGTSYCFGYVDDIARGHLQAMTRGRAGESYIIAGPHHTFGEFFRTCEQLSGVPRPRLEPPAAALRALAGVVRVVGAVLPLPETYRYESLRVMAGVTYGGDDRKARRELGFTTRSLEEGLRPTLAECMHELGMPLPPALESAAAR
jgi:nucleoside-diphosphate-sugar epimerase